MRSLILATFIAAVAGVPQALIHEQHSELQVEADPTAATSASSTTVTATTTVATTTAAPTTTHAPNSLIFCNAAYSSASSTASITSGTTTFTANYGTCTTAVFPTVNQNSVFTVGWGGKTNVLTTQLFNNLCSQASWNTYVVYPQGTSVALANPQNGGNCSPQSTGSNVRVSYFDAITVAGPQGGVPVQFTVNGKNVLQGPVDFGSSSFIDTTTTVAVPSGTTTLGVSAVSDTTAIPAAYASFTVNGLAVPSTKYPQDVTFIAYGQVNSKTNPPSIMVTPYSGASSLIVSTFISAILAVVAVALMRRQ